ncbi:dipeptidyl aminopeptidase/acylaminoacyl peptidase [Brevundimonas alba]|uniref:Dipeptidyl aminopeptidase/acylaminoacyl peptidase n=1 Tax=Brevundimonas alba TaxID=74314 RepID=A0A7X5YMG3_9CAUL|nr:dienelactone hydrolase family protein [Brevundimonas alba]NJC42660.1 dipeptidyl aminopeptidase/acylaminoacyl peptidase [Brevundimonas alba]
MRRGAFFTVAVAGAAVLLSGASSGAAQTPPSPPQVGISGCTDDVPVRATRELISFESRGRDIRAYLYTPRGEVNGAAIVLLHGGTGFEMNSILFDAHAIQLASRGYLVMLPAYFDAASPDQGRPTVTRRLWRQVALDAAAALAAEPGVKPAEVALWGYSRGAFVAADAVTDPNSPIRSAVLAAGGGEVTESVAGRDVSVLLLHAERDEAVPVRSTRRLAETLREAGAAVDVQPLDFIGHQYDLRTWCDVFARTRTFLEGRAEADNGPA